MSAARHLAAVAEPATQIDYAFCRHPGYHPGPGEPSFWEGIADGETRRDRDRRQAIAVKLCRECPLLGPCTNLLSDLDDRRLAVDGVIAGQVRQWRTRTKKKRPRPPHLS